MTVLDTHDGIGVIDVGADSAGTPGLLSPAEIDRLVETIHERSNNQSRQATGAAASNLDLYQVNCTFYDALGRSDDEYLIARALQFFAPGIPQVYYVGLLAGTNDMDLLARTRRRPRHQPALLHAAGDRSGAGDAGRAPPDRVDAVPEQPSRLRRGRRGADAVRPTVW